MAEPNTAQRLLNEPYVRPMDFTGRPLKGFLFVGAEALKKKGQLQKYVSLSLDFASSLPPKTAEADKKRAARGQTKSSSKRSRD